MKSMLEKPEPYLIQSKIAQGGMAFVYEAIDSRSGQTVALKILRIIRDCARRMRPLWGI